MKKPDSICLVRPRIKVQRIGSGMTLRTQVDLLVHTVLTISVMERAVTGLRDIVLRIIAIRAISQTHHEDAPTGEYVALRQ